MTKGIVEGSEIYNKKLIRKCKGCGKEMKRTKRQKEERTAIKYFNTKKQFCGNRCVNKFYGKEEWKSLKKRPFYEEIPLEDDYMSMPT